MAASALSSPNSQKIDRLHSAQETVLKNVQMTFAILTFVPNTTDCSVNRLFRLSYCHTRSEVTADELTGRLNKRDLQNASHVSRWLNLRPNIVHIDLRKLLVNLQDTEEMQTLDQIIAAVSSALKNHSQLRSLVLPHEATQEDVIKMVQSVSGSSQLRALDFSPCTHPNFNFSEMLKNCPKLSSVAKLSFFIKDGENQVELFKVVSEKFPNAKEFCITAEATQPPLRVHTLFQQFPRMERLELEQFNFNEKDPGRRVRVTPDQWKQLPKLPALKVLLIRDCVFTQFILNCILAAVPSKVRWDATGNLQGRVSLSGGRDSASPCIPNRPSLANGANRTPSPMFVLRTLSPFDQLQIKRSGHDDSNRALFSHASFDSKAEHKVDHKKTDNKDSGADGKRTRSAVKLKYSASSGTLRLA
jgi:hypothetical protein